VSIIIQNIDKNLRATGEHDYVLRINQKRIAYFKHNREDGLAVCLEKAAAAARDPHRAEVQDDNEFLMATFHALGAVDRRGTLTKKPNIDDLE
jgi:hypothetical protein